MAKGKGSMAHLCKCNHPREAHAAVPKGAWKRHVGRCWKLCADGTLCKCEGFRPRPAASTLCRQCLSHQKGRAFAEKGLCTCGARVPMPPAPLPKGDLVMVVGGTRAQAPTAREALATMADLVLFLEWFNATDEDQAGRLLKRMGWDGKSAAQAWVRDHAKRLLGRA